MKRVYTLYRVSNLTVSRFPYLCIFISMVDIRKKSLPTVNLCGILVDGLSLDGSKWACFPGSKITCQPCERRLLL